MITQEKYQNILVGGSGFIGSALSALLLEKGESVLSISRHGSSRSGKVKEQKLDVGDEEVLRREFPQGENIFILIGQNSSDFSPEEEKKRLENLISVLNVTLPKKVFYLSSALIYGECAAPAEETMKPQPVDAYSHFKREAEDLLKNTLDKRITLGIFRLANVYGTSKNKGFLGFILSRVTAKSEEKITLNGDGKQERDYIFVEDAVRAMMTVAGQMNEDDIVNISTGKSVSLVELMREVSRRGKVTVPYEINGKRLVEVEKSLVSNKKLREKYGFVPEFSLEQGLSRALKQFEAAAVERANEMLLLGGEGFIGKNIALYFSQKMQCFSVGKAKSRFEGNYSIFIPADPYKEKVDNHSGPIIHLIDNKVSLPDFILAEKELVGYINLNANNHLIIISSIVLVANPNSEYGTRKRELEKFYTDYCKEKDIPLTILRVYNTYGLFQIPYRQGSLIGNLIYNHLAGKKTEINDMEAERDFVFSGDIPKFIEHVLKYKIRGIFDVGSGKLIKVRDIVSCLEEKVFKEKIQITDKKVKDSVVSPAAQVHFMESIHMVGLEEGLRETVDFYKTNKDVIQSYVD